MPTDTINYHYLKIKLNYALHLLDQIDKAETLPNYQALKQLELIGKDIENL